MKMENACEFFLILFPFVSVVHPRFTTVYSEHNIFANEQGIHLIDTQ